MLRVLSHSLWGYRMGLIFVAAGVLAFEMLIALVWRSLGEETAIAFINLMPESMRELMEAQFGFALAAGLPGWLAGVNRHPIYLILLASFAVGGGVAAVARDVERGSILLVLSRPVARWRFLLGKIGASSLGLLLLGAITVTGIYVGSLLVGEDLVTGPFLWVAANGYLLFLTIQGVALLLSAIGDDASATAGRAAGIVLTAYFIDFLAHLWDRAEFLGPLSFFHYYNPSTVVQSGDVPWWDMGVLLTVVVVLHAVALALFQRRDIAR